MCNFFSFLSDGDHKLYYFSAADRRKRVKFRDGQSVQSYDSHTSIALYYGLNEDDWSKAEYNPFTDKLTIDQQHTTWDEDKVRGMLTGVDWRGLCGDLEGVRAFLRELKDITWFQPDGTLTDGAGIRVFETWAAARAAAWDAARDAARDAAVDAAWDAALDAAWDAALDAAWAAAWAAARDAAWAAAWDAAWAAARDAAVDAAWDAAWDAERNAARAAERNAARAAGLYICVVNVCDGLPIAQEHIDHVRKRMDVWRHGYGVLCDVDGVLYCYERL